MHINALFICALVPESRYIRFNEQGHIVDVPIYLAIASLLPIVRCPRKVSIGGTWWPVRPTLKTFLADFHYARSRGLSTVVITPEYYALILALSAEEKKNLELIVVPNAEDALLATARAWRLQCMVPIIAVTGSIGKTTTIGFLSSIFSVDQLPVLVSAPDDHDLMTLACDVLHITEKQVAAVFEVGAFWTGDVLTCADLLQPTIAIITAICPAHLQGIHSLHQIAGETQKIFSHFSPSQVGIVCGDYPILATHAYEHPVVKFGLKNKNVITARKITVIKDGTGALKTKMILRIYDYEQEIVLNGNHRGMIYAALAAASLAHFLYIPFHIVVKGISSYVPGVGRFYQYALREGRGVLIQDNYSISPESVKAALHAVHAIESAQRKIAVIGNIPDLGDKTSFWHRHVGRELIKTRSISDLVLVGDATKPIYSVAPATMKIWFAAEWSDVIPAVHNLLAPKDNVVLVTGAAPTSINNCVAQLT